MRLLIVGIILLILLMTMIMGMGREVKREEEVEVGSMERRDRRDGMSFVNTRLGVISLGGIRSWGIRSSLRLMCSRRVHIPGRIIRGPLGMGLRGLNV